MRNLLLRASHSQWLERQVRGRPFARRAASRFMPGESLDDALGAARRLAEQHLTAVLTELGENVTTVAEVEGVTRHYGDVLDRLAAAGLAAQISVKLTHLGLDLSEATCHEQVRRLAAQAHRHGNFVWIDMEGSAYTERTLAVFRDVRREFDNVGVCLQAYLYRTVHDLERLAPLSPAIRLVKGAYQEPPAIAFPRKRDVDANYLALARQLLADERFRGCRPGFGTHDVPLVRAVAAQAESIGVPRHAFEVQMLYGIRREAQLALARDGFAVRVLISYGTAWFRWYMRRLAERPANVWFVVRSIIG